MADRFYDVAASHLEHFNAIASSHGGQVLAITLLNNASFKENTLKSTELQLISLEEERCKYDLECSVQDVKLDRLNPLMGIAAKLVEKNMNIVSESANLAENSDFLNFYHHFWAVSRASSCKTEKMVHSNRLRIFLCLRTGLANSTSTTKS